MFTLGNKPQAMNVQLDQDGDFVASLTAPNAGWPQGAIVRLELPTIGIIWYATLTSTHAQWNIDKTIVNGILAAHPGVALPARLYYTEGSSELLWGTGVVRTGP